MFVRADLEALGFEGWLPFQSSEAWSYCPVASGVYAVVREPSEPPVFEQRSPAGWFKGRDPSVPLEALQANWVDGAEVIYIGKANSLRRRLRELRRFGAGEPVGHWGGRLIWQLAHESRLSVAWKETPGVAPEMVEAELLESFRQKYGKYPFANNPHRLGR